jgi:hypothetical protein
VSETAALVTPDNGVPLNIALRRDAEGAYFEIPSGAFTAFAFLRMEVQP